MASSPLRHRWAWWLLVAVQLWFVLGWIFVIQTQMSTPVMRLVALAVAAFFAYRLWVTVRRLRS